MKKIYLPREKSLKAPCIVFADSECRLYRKKTKHKPSGYSWSLICSFDNTKNKQYFYREKDCIKKFCKDLDELGMEIINFKKKETKPLTNKEIKSYEKQKIMLYM